MSTHKILFYGFGGHGQVTASALPDELVLSGFFDNVLPVHWPAHYPYLGAYDPAVLPELPLIITIGDNQIRKRLSETIRHPFAKMLSKYAFCAPGVEIGDGTVVLQMAVIQARASVGMHSIVNAGVVVDHDSKIGNYVHLGPGSTVASLAQVGDEVFLGAGAVIPSKSVVPAGTIIPPGTVYGEK